MRKINRDTDRQIAVITGVFFIIATAMGILNAAMVGPIFGSEYFLAEIYANSGLVRLSTLLNVVMALAVVAIGISIFPILKRTHETLAVGYLAIRTIEGTVLAIGGIAWLALIPIATEFVQAGAPDASHFQTLGDTLINASTSMFTLGAEIVFGVSALILNYILMRAKLLPPLISIWGLVGGALILVLGIMKILGLPTGPLEIAFTAPIALNEMVLAVWLIAKDFKEPSA